MKALDYDDRFWNGFGSTVFVGCNSDRHSSGQKILQLSSPAEESKYWYTRCVSWSNHGSFKGRRAIRVRKFSPLASHVVFPTCRQIQMQYMVLYRDLQSCAHWPSCTPELEDGLCTNSRHELIIHLWRPSDKLAASRPRATAQWRQLSSTSR